MAIEAYDDSNSAKGGGKAAAPGDDPAKCGYTVVKAPDMIVGNISSTNSGGSHRDNQGTSHSAYHHQPAKIGGRG